MSERSEDVHKRVSPKEFMRNLRPELYSDTATRTAYQLDAAMLEYHLDSLTSRNQHHDFEIFCRKLCQRTICPNLLPATGPEGGGDSKADTETIPAADEISIFSYVGLANAGHERWAFAFSAKKTWADKVRKDVAGIVETERGYTRIFCVTSQFARAKDRSRVEDELTNKYGISVTILDRSWIVEQVIAGDRKDLAFNYLGIGLEVVDTRRLGPNDYSRTQQLEDIEKSLSDPQAYSGMEMHLVTEALVAAKLSRSLDRPRFETDGRFTRAVRLANAQGTLRQRLDANYELIWTGFWWFDDVALLNSSYDAFESLVLDTAHAKNLEFLCNLAQILFNSVIHGHLTASEAKLTERIKRLSERLDELMNDTERPNNALEALTSKLVIDVNWAVLTQQPKSLELLWPKFSEVIQRAKGLGEFSADRLIKLIDAFGMVAGSDPGYARLVDEVAAFVAERTGEGQGALVLLKRANQLDLEDHFEIIRLLGKASRQLSKEEYSDSLIDALQLLTIAYRSAGLLWAARASCIFTLASIFIDAGEDSNLPVSVVPTIMLLGWIAIELRHIPEALEAIRLARGCAAKLPLDEASKARFSTRLLNFDMVLASQILNFTPSELEHAGILPDVLNRLELHQSRNALLYVLGHESILRSEGSIPADETSEGVVDFYTLLASQPASDNLHIPVIFNEPGQQILVSKVLGMRIEVHHNGSDSSTLAAEAVIGSIEALFATALDLHAASHTESFTVRIEESDDVIETDFTLNREKMSATVLWPLGQFPATYGKQVEVQNMLISLSVTIFAATCVTKDMEGTFKRFFDEEAVLDRIAMIVVVGNSYQRIFTNSVSRLSDWEKFSTTSFKFAPSRPTIVRRNLLSSTDEGERSAECSKDQGRKFHPTDHRDLSVRSIIDVHLWDRALWSGTAFANYGQSNPPMIGLLFKNADAARQIFERWRERFGSVDKGDEIFVAIVRGIVPTKPAHYRVLITSRLPRETDSTAKGQQMMFATRTQTMHAESNANLDNFLDIYNQVSVYLLVPAIWTGQGQPEFLMDLAILKRGLSVKAAADVGENDLEAIALGPKLSDK